MSLIVFSDYPILSTFAIVAQSGLTAAAPSTTVNGAKYGSQTNFVATNFVSGPGASNDNLVAAATAQLGLLKAALVARRAVLPSVPISGATGGTVTYLPNINYNSADTIIFSTSAAVTLDAQGNPNAQFYFRAGSSITLGASTFTLVNGAQPGNVFWDAAVTISSTGVSPIPGILLGGTGEVTFATATTINGRIYTPGTLVSFAAATTVNALGPTLIPCYAKGTMILTPRGGFVPIEQLQVDDAVVTRGVIQGESFVPHLFQSRLIRWIAHFTLRNPPAEVSPIRIQKHALGHDMPHRDLFVSPGHKMILGGKTVSAWQMVNGTTITQDTDRDEVTYYHFELDEHSGVVANGLVSETLAGDELSSNRGVFEKAAPRPAAYRFTWGSVSV